VRARSRRPCESLPADSPPGIKDTTISTITLFGASGSIGTAISAELVKRGHTVISVSRKGTSTVDGVTAVSGDGSNTRYVAEVAAGSDVITSAIGPRFDGTDELDSLSTIATALVEGARRADIKRLVIVGGAGSLIEADGTRHVDTDHFAPEYRPLALAHARALGDVYEKADDLDWTYVSPPEFIFPGPAVGTFRTGGNHLERNDKGEHRISIDDYAIGFVDAIEDSTGIRQQITFAY